MARLHVKIPTGFGALLEALTREILRDQPKDIPKYAAEYFETLLQRREESGTDPAKLEDRNESNQANKPSDFNKTSKDSMAEDHSEDDLSVAPNQTSQTDDAHLTESEEESYPIITRAESADGPRIPSADPNASTHSQSDGLSNEINNSAASSQNHSYSERHDAQSQKERAIEVQQSESRREDGDRQLSDQEEDKPGSVNSGAADLDEETADVVSVMEEDAEQMETLKTQSNEIRPESPVSQVEMTEQGEEKESNDANAAAPIDTALDFDQDNSLVEVDFEDVPENQQTMDENEPNMETVDMANDHTKLSQDEEVGSEKGEDDGKEEINSNHDSREENVGIDTEDLPTAKAKDHVEGQDTDNVDNEKSSQKDELENNLDFTHDTALVVEDTNDTETDGQPEVEHQKLLETEAESEMTNAKIMEKSGDDLSEDDEEEQDEGQSLDKYLPKELLSGEEEHEEDEHDPEFKEDLPSGELESVYPDLDDTRADKEDIHLPEEQQDNPDPEGDANDKQEECSRPQEEEDIMDIPLDDPEANRAAAKIQAGFRGHMTRKKMKPEDKTEGEERQDDRGQ